MNNAPASATAQTTNPITTLVGNLFGAIIVGTLEDTTARSTK